MTLRPFVKSVQHALEYALVRFAFTAFSRMSFPALSRFGDWLGGFAFRFIPIRRRVTLDNLSRAFPAKTSAEIYAIARQVYRNFGRTFIQFLGLSGCSHADIRSYIRIDEAGLKILNDALQAGKGAIIITAHFGNWELLNLAFGAYGFPGGGLVRTQKNRRVDVLINQIREQTGCRSIPLGIAVREVLRGLKRGEVVGIVGDQHFGKKGSVWTQFFGRPVRTAQGIASFHLKTGAPMVMAFSYHQRDGYLTTHFERLEYASLNETEEACIQRITQLMTTRLEAEIRRYPDHWFWMHRRWKDSERGADFVLMQKTD